MASDPSTSPFYIIIYLYPITDLPWLYFGLCTLSFSVFPLFNSSPLSVLPSFLFYSSLFPFLFLPLSFSVLPSPYLFFPLLLLFPLSFSVLSPFIFSLSPFLFFTLFFFYSSLFPFLFFPPSPFLYHLLFHPLPTFLVFIMFFNSS